MHFNPVTRVSDLSDGYKIHLFDNFSSVDFIYLILFLSLDIDKLHDLMKKFFLIEGSHGNTKKTVIIATIIKGRNASSKT